jgi:hypothetical protein
MTIIMKILGDRIILMKKFLWNSNLRLSLVVLLDGLNLQKFRRHKSKKKNLYILFYTSFYKNRIEKMQLKKKIV